MSLSDALLDRNEEEVRAPIPAYEDVLIPAAAPQPARTNGSVQNLIIGIFTYCVVQGISSCLVYNFATANDCDARLGLYLISNAFICLLYAMICFASLRVAPYDWSELAIANDHTKSYQWMIIIACKLFVGLLDFICFIYGNVEFFSALSCTSGSATSLIVFSGFIIALSYVSLIFPLAAFAYVHVRYGEFIWRPRAREGSRPATKAEINSCALGRYSSVEPGHEPMCAVCYVDYEPSSLIRKLPCHHIFHQTCVDDWLQIRDCCPLCKHRIGVREPGNMSTFAQNLSTIASNAPGALSAGLNFVANQQQLSSIAAVAPGHSEGASSHSESNAQQRLTNAREAAVNAAMGRLSLSRNTNTTVVVQTGCEFADLASTAKLDANV